MCPLSWPNGWRNHGNTKMLTIVWTICLEYHILLFHCINFFKDVIAKLVLVLHSTFDNMTKRGKMKAKIFDYEWDVEVAEFAPVPRVDIIYEDTKAIIGSNLEFKWGHIYHLLVEKKVPEAGLEVLALYDNVLRSGITRVTTRPKIFPCVEVTRWILPRIDTTGMLMNDTENKYLASFSPHFYQ